MHTQCVFLLNLYNRNIERKTILTPTAYFENYENYFAKSYAFVVYLIIDVCYNEK